jgi:hypothetical protein
VFGTGWVSKTVWGFLGLHVYFKPLRHEVRAMKKIKGIEDEGGDCIAVQPLDHRTPRFVCGIQISGFDRVDASSSGEQKKRVPLSGTN